MHPVLCTNTHHDVTDLANHNLNTYHDITDLANHNLNILRMEDIAFLLCLR